MNFSNIEEKIVEPFYRYVHLSRANINDIFLIKWKGGTAILAKYDTCYESDNNLDLDDPDYEDFVGIAIKIIKIKKISLNDNLFPDKSINCQNVYEWFKEDHLYELNYHNFPDEIYNSRGELISKREN